MDNIFKDAILVLRPKFNLATNYESASKCVNDLLQELTPKVQEVLPNFKLQTDSKDMVTNQEPNTGLNPIAEVEEMDNEMESVRDEETSHHESESEDEYEFNEAIPQHLEFRQKGTTDEENNGSESDANIPSDEGLEQTESRDTSLKTVHCPEDDDFLKDFDKMMSESLVSRSQEVVRSNTDIVIPVNRNTKKSVAFSDGINRETNEEKEVPTINFMIMTRTKGNKPLLKNVDVPFDSELVATLKAREEAEKAEKKNIKKLILDINERREMEDRDAELERGTASGSSVSNANRDHRRRYQHQKGVPDVDIIFGNKYYQQFVFKSIICYLNFI